MREEFVKCPICGNKTRAKVRDDTIMINFPLFCSKCKYGSIYAYCRRGFSTFAAFYFSVGCRSPPANLDFQKIQIGGNDMAYNHGKEERKVGSSLVPFVNKFPRNTELYRLMTTKFGEV